LKKGQMWTSAAHENYGTPGINFLNHNLWEVWFEGYKQYVDPFRWVNDPYVY